jgi:tRNA (guanine-N7-)-methyltransferase
MTSYGSLRPYIPWRERDQPIDWSQEFGRQAPLKIELGFGNGDYLIRTAQGDPDANYLGIEMTWGSVWRALRTTRKAGVENVRLLLEDARTALLWTLTESSVHSFLGLFPCPWPKKRHAKNRLFSPSFLLLCNSRLEDGGTLTVVTDAPAYRDQMLEELTLPATGMSCTLETIAASFGTKYERKWQSEGQQEFYQLTFRKVQHRAIQQPEITPVKHHKVTDFNPQTFAPQSEKEPHNVTFKSFLYDSERQIAMQEVVTHEDAIDQHFWVRIKKGAGGWTISPASGSALLPLPSVQRALDLIAAASC